jgi:hypothetical protein
VTAVPTATIAAPPRADTSNRAPTRGAVAPATPRPNRLLGNWVAIQGLNLVRQVRALRPFEKEEFGTGPAAPSEVHIAAVNRFIDEKRVKALDASRWVEAAAKQVLADPNPGPTLLNLLLDRKTKVTPHVLYVEGLWDFYFDLFVQRLSRMSERLLSVDRIGANCYEDIYLGLGTARPVPTLLPYSYADAGFSPLTYRRGVPLRQLRHNRNLFPLITLPQHRLANPWALSSVLHEVSHNLQSDLGLWDVMPKLLFTRLTQEGLPDTVAATWARWHKETMADVFALLLGGPAAIESLMDVVGRDRAATTRFDGTGVHPTPYLRALISLELLRRLGFGSLADDFTAMWTALYPNVGPEEIPAPMLGSFDKACALVVDTMAFQPHPQLANQPLAHVIRFGPRHLDLIAEAGRRLAKNDDPGTIPPRFLIGAARHAIDQRLAPPETITDNFYRVLGRR